MTRLSAKKTKTSKRRKRKIRRRQGDSDLPRKLLAATEDILREQGLHKFTLREAARRAGVSHGAPGYHFKDASGLLTAFAAEGYDALTQLMLRYRAEAAKEPAAQLIAVGHAYIDYAVSHRPQFQLMFRSDAIRREDEHFAAASKATFQQLRETIAPFLTPGQTDAEHAIKLMLAWSAVHGFATLYLEKGFYAIYRNNPKPPVSADAKRMLEALQASFLIKAG